jgi:hypothetical protein
MHGRKICFKGLPPRPDGGLLLNGEPVLYLRYPRLVVSLPERTYPTPANDDIIAPLRSLLYGPATMPRWRAKISRVSGAERRGRARPQPVDLNRLVWE